MKTEQAGSCQGCGASVYPEHLESGIAKMMDGKLFCAHCAKEQDAAASGEFDLMEPIPLDDDLKGGTSVEVSESVIAVSAQTLNVGKTWDESRFTRPLEPDTMHATRCRMFHAKLSDGAIDYLNGQINEWLDQNKEISIKFCNSTIGPFEGKHTEPNIIMSLFY